MKNNWVLIFLFNLLWCISLEKHVTNNNFYVSCCGVEWGIAADIFTIISFSAPHISVCHNFRNVSLLSHDLYQSVYMLLVNCTYINTDILKLETNWQLHYMHAKEMDDNKFILLASYGGRSRGGWGTLKSPNF